MDGRRGSLSQSAGKEIAGGHVGMPNTLQRKDGLAMPGGLKNADLESLNKLSSKYIHSKTLLG